MAFDAFIEIEGIEGESTDHNHKDWIELISCYTGLYQAISSTANSAGGASAERSDFLPFRFTKLLDRSSPMLALACAAGTHIDRVIIEMCRAGTENRPTCNTA